MAATTRCIASNGKPSTDATHASQQQSPPATTPSQPPVVPNNHGAEATSNCQVLAWGVSIAGDRESNYTNAITELHDRLEKVNPQTAGDETRKEQVA